MGYKYIFFDFDGTVSDSKDGVIDGFVYALDHYGIKAENKESFKKYVGPPLLESFSEYFPEKEKAQDAVDKFREYYDTKGVMQNSMFPGIDTLLKRLKKRGKVLVVATSKLQKYADLILQKFGVFELFDFVSGHDMESGRGNKTAVIKYAINKLGITDLTQAVMVGDRKYDIFGAKEVGMDSIGVLYGYGERQELEEAGATHVAVSVEDIENYV